MASKFVIFCVLVSLAVVHGAKLSTKENTEIVSTEREGRTLELPLVGLLVWKTLTISWFVLTTAWNFVGWKLAAVTLVATVAFNVVSWVYSNLYSVAITMAIYGFCKITGKCYPDYISTGLNEVGANLYYAAKNLNSGIALYDNDL